MSNLIDGVTISKRVVFSNKHSEGGPTKFKVNFQNAMYNQGNILRILPMDIFIPNMFNNVTSSNNVSVWEEVGVGIFEVRMPVGHYTVEEYMNEFAIQVDAIIGLGVSVVSWLIEPISNLLSITWSLPVEYLGGDENTTSNTLLGSKAMMIVPIGATLVFDYPPQFQGESAVIILTDMASSNCSHGKDNQQITMLDLVSLTDTCYGAVKHHRIISDHARAFSFSSDPDLRNFTISLVDIDKKPLTLPENSEVIIHLLVGFGSYN